MNEPLTSSLQPHHFIGKTYNKHPQWYNQPLRLTKEGKHNPILILEEFYQCYHLNEVREMLWSWLVEVLSSPHGISCDPNERSNHIYFYEKLEEALEAAFVVKKKSQKRLRKQRRKRNRNKTRVEKAKTANYKKSEYITSHEPEIENIEDDEVLNKPKRLIEKVKKEPLNVIREVFKSEPLHFLRDQLRDWLHVALSNENSTYETSEEKSQLVLFHDELQPLVEAVFIIHMQEVEATRSNEEIADSKKIMLLSREQIANPRKVLIEFFIKFPLVYIRRELWDWFSDGVTHTGTYPENSCRDAIVYTYEYISCLVEAAYYINKVGRLQEEKH